jgi:hypothetical protein
MTQLQNEHDLLTGLNIGLQWIVELYDGGQFIACDEQVSLWKKVK